MIRGAAWSLVIVAVAAGLAFRLARLDARPMHHDEANQAVKFGALLETGQYTYDRADHHGPTLYYLTLPSAWLRGQATLASLDERTLRIVPALFGAGLLLLFALLARDLGRPSALAATALAAVSPALTYYSRFYIQEALLAFFALGFVIALGRWTERPSTSRAISSGLFIGLAFATKETSLLVLAAAVVASAAARATRAPGGAAENGQVAARGPRWAHLFAFLAAALAVVVVFYTSFFTNWAGPVDAFRSVGVYFGRGLEAGSHDEPWYYYLRLLAWSRSGGLAWSEGLVLALALAGGVAALTRRGGFWPAYLAWYSLLACVAFSAVRYKTPWNLLPFYVGVVALAGWGAAAIVALARPRAVKALLVAALVIGIGHLAIQARRANFGYPADARNPYVYAQTTTDFLGLVQRVSDLAAIHPQGRAMLVKVVAGPYEQWPLPWYLRRMTAVGYWTRAEAAAPLDAAPVVVASQEDDAAIGAALGDRYVSEFYGLRPGVLLTLHVERGLWERFLERAGTGPGPAGAR